MRVQYYAFLFLFIISSFVIAPTIQQMLTGSNTIITITEINEEEEKAHKDVIQFRCIVPNNDGDKSQFLHYKLRYYLQHKYDTPSLKIHLPPPELG